MDIRDLDWRALEVCGVAVAAIGPDELHHPTPCDDWTLHGLVRHLVSENLGFAGAAGGAAWDPAAWNAGLLGDDPYAAYLQSAETVTKAFSPDAVLDRQVEVREFGVFPGRVAISFHFIDFLVHGWDVAQSIGAPFSPDEDLLDAALKIASKVPATPESRGPGRAFGIPVPIDEDAPAFDRLLAMLGRAPR